LRFYRPQIILEIAEVNFGREKRGRVNILEAIKDRHLFSPFLGENLDSCQPWATALRACIALGTAQFDSSSSGSRLKENAHVLFKISPAESDSAIKLHERNRSASHPIAEGAF
jgi:hypothetical protein